MSEYAKLRRPVFFGKIWPLIQSYQGKSFSLSKFINDFPALSDEPYLPADVVQAQRNRFSG